MLISMVIIPVGGVFHFCPQFNSFPTRGNFCCLLIIFANSLDPDQAQYQAAQLVKCLATDASLIADPGVTSSIPARSHTFVEIYHEIISSVILLPSAESYKKGCCQLHVKVCALSTGQLLVQACPGKSVVR